ncbi:aspartic proteinase Asp1 [Tanacetum coccineum]
MNVPCKYPLCASLHSGDHRCDDPGQCAYEVEYADGGSSLGVLFNDASLRNLTIGVRITPRLAIGFVTLPPLESNPSISFSNSNIVL